MLEILFSDPPFRAPSRVSVTDHGHDGSRRRSSISYVGTASIAFNLALPPDLVQRDATLTEDSLHGVPKKYLTDSDDEDQEQEKKGRGMTFQSKVARDLCYLKYGRPTPKFMDKPGCAGQRRGSLGDDRKGSLLDTPKDKRRKASLSAIPRIRHDSTQPDASRSPAGISPVRHASLCPTSTKHTGNLLAVPVREQRRSSLPENLGAGARRVLCSKEIATSSKK